ncbi:alpha/beta-hydrolase [Rhizodiscina lignyota]|uniref:cutinase n=1 Tax=Rhizodiscina lignyota TaxID=1504668 RepID=A0A9P4I5B0_9PEZI|nr:alpha/beta-hydrolase [Rhizodiscina lignyota]
MARIFPIAILVAIVGSITWLGRTLWIDELRYPFMFRISGGDPSLNVAWKSTETDLPCAKYEIIYARGSTEPTPLGYLIGPKLAAELRKHLGDDPKEALIVGLDWMANFVLPDSGVQGIERLIERVQRRAKQCPNMHFALAGYSQGADVIRISLQSLTDYKEQIRAIAVWGDPLTSIGWPPYYKGRVLNLCNPGDRACGGKGIIRHFIYATERDELHVPAAEFIAEKLKDEREGTGPAAFERLPVIGAGVAFLFPWKEFPPPEWQVDFPEGVVAPTIGLKGVGMQDIKAWKDEL